jgi:hypothetical protein
VALGAALRGLCGLKPKSRRCRRHYGFQLDLPYDPHLDDERNMYINQFDKTKRARGTMVWPLSMVGESPLEFVNVGCGTHNEILGLGRGRRHVHMSTRHAAVV